MKPSQGWRAKMIKVTVSKEARKDLVNIHRYISEELENPQAANRIIHELRSAAEDLQLFPRRGKPLDALISVHTEYRYLPCENYCSFTPGQTSSMKRCRGFFFSASRWASHARRRRKPSMSIDIIAKNVSPEFPS